MTTREEQWLVLYNELLNALSRFGENSPSDPQGDYWLVDDDWGGHHHKVCVAHPGFWSSEVEQQVRAILANSFRDWGVYVVFEDGSGRSGLIVYGDRTVTERSGLEPEGNL